ncbi:hypothetical protein SUGI_0340850 [Cryptomeria japonica]|uniref:phosphoprotein ECPP44-like n=1 Tax=Cryptomeria japonica TaxID=3369 RepID=UPI002408CFBD|nr:phosphoprotein ECPP44-like [Cryptomeria japonica]GLJ19010.1 hypothetical protein SUGI_0340850 [Cryptomeria japonica]
MAEENAGKHQDRGLFGLFGKKKEEETHQQHVSAVGPHVAGVTPHEQGHVGEAHPVPVSHGHVEEGKLHGEGEEKKQEGGLMAKLHRSNSSSSSSSSDEEEDKASGEERGRPRSWQD